jgi:hypothetical protein
MTYEDLLIELANLSEEQLQKEVIFEDVETQARSSTSDVDWVIALDSDQPIILF